jgi:CheY-like chemotaxis protein
MSIHGLRILVAEDEPLAALVIEEILVAEGHSVCLAGDGREALELAQHENFDLLITDLAMPRMTGQELIQALRAMRPDLPVVVMTGYLSPDTAELLRATLCPPLALLHKPFDLDHLVRVVSRIAAPELSRLAEMEPSRLDTLETPLASA